MPNGIYCALFDGNILLLVLDYLKQEVSKHWNSFDHDYLRIVTNLYLFSSSEKFRLLLIDCIWDKWVYSHKRSARKYFVILCQS